MKHWRKSDAWRAPQPSSWVPRVSKVASTWTPGELIPRIPRSALSSASFQSDPAPIRERRVMRALDGLGGLAPVALGGDPHGRWSKYPTSLISWLDGQPDITPTDPWVWAGELGRARSEHWPYSRGDAPLGLLGRRAVRSHGWVLGPELPPAGPWRPR